MDDIYHARLGEHRFEKECIGAYVAHYLRTYACRETIAVDGGSTNFHVLEAICRDVKESRPTVSLIVTNHLEGLNMAREIPEEKGLVWRCTGGLLRGSRATLIGGPELDTKELRSRMAIIGVNGFEPPCWLNTITGTENSMKRAMIEQGHHVLFPIDSSKWGVQGHKMDTLYNIVTHDKRAILVTCYPMRDGNETDAAFDYRTAGFSDAVQKLVELWPSEPNHMEAHTAAITRNSVLVKEQQFRVGEGLLSEIRASARAASANRRDQTGLVIRFDLWRD